MKGHLKHGSIHKAKAEQSSILLLVSHFTLHTTAFRKQMLQLNSVAWNIKISSKLMFCGQIISNKYSHKTEFQWLKKVFYKAKVNCVLKLRIITQKGAEDSLQRKDFQILKEIEKCNVIVVWMYQNRTKISLTCYFFQINVLVICVETVPIIWPK